MTSKYQGNLDFYLSLINKRLPPNEQITLGGESGKDGLKSNGSYVGHLVDSVSDLYSVVYTAYCIIEKIEKAQQENDPNWTTQDPLEASQC